MYVPKTRGELNDLILSMILLAPDFTSDNLPGESIETMFEALFLGLDRIARVIGESGRQEMSRMAGSAKEHFGSGRADDGISALFELSEYLRTSAFKKQP